MADNKQPESIGFNQADWQVHGNVYNVNGNLALNENSTRKDLSKLLSDLSDELSKLQNLPTDLEQEIKSLLKAAALSSGEPDAEKDSISESLINAKEALTSVKDTVDGAWDLAKTITKVAAWVSAYLI